MPGRFRDVLARRLPGIIHPRRGTIMTNVWDAIRTTARDPEVDNGLLEETRRLMRLVSLGDRHATVAQAMSNVVGKKGTWEDVSVALCGSIHAALVALATLQEDPETFFSEYLRPHPDGQAWTWPHFPEGPAGVITTLPADPAHLPTRTPVDGFFVSSPPPAAAEPTNPPTTPAPPGGLTVRPRPVSWLPENVQIVHHDIAQEEEGPVMLDRFAGPFPDLAPHPFWRTPVATPGHPVIGPLMPTGGIPPMLDPALYRADHVAPPASSGYVRSLQEMTPGVHFAAVDPAHTDRDSA